MEMNNMKISLFPTSKLGIEAAGFSVAFLIFTWIRIQFTMPIEAYIIYSLGIIGFFLGIVAIIKNKERSIFGFLPILVGLAMIFFAAGGVI